MPTGDADTVATPHGGTAARCGTTTGKGVRCSKAARRGYRTCASHPVKGESEPVEEDDRKGPGRPPSHGLYSRSGATNIRALRDQVSTLEIDLDDTDEELRTVKSVLWFLLGQAEKYETKTVMLETALTAIEDVLEDATVVHKGVPGDGLSVAQARQLGAQLAAGYWLMSEVNGWTGRLLDSNLRAISAVKMRAETSAKLAEQKSLETFAGLAGQITRIIWELAPDSDWLDVYEDRLRRDILTPNRLEHPAPRPEKLN